MVAAMTTFGTATPNNARGERGPTCGAAAFRAVHSADRISRCEAEGLRRKLTGVSSTLEGAQDAELFPLPAEKRSQGLLRRTSSLMSPAVPRSLRLRTRDEGGQRRASRNLLVPKESELLDPAAVSITKRGSL
jgi:hypothetical protein